MDKKNKGPFFPKKKEKSAFAKFEKRGEKTFEKQGEKPYEKRGEKTFEKRGEKPFEKRGEKTFEKHGEKPFEKRGEKTFEKRGEKPFEKRGEKTFEKQGEKPYEKRGEKTFEKQGEKPYEKRGEKTFEKQGEKPYEKRGEKTFEKRGEKPFEKRGEKTFEKRGEKPYEKRGEKTFEARGEKPFEKRGEKTFEKRGEKPFEKRGEKTFEKQGEKPYEKRGEKTFEARGEKPYEKRGEKPFEKRGEKTFEKPKDLNVVEETAGEEDDADDLRLNKYLAHAGVASRRKADEIIKEGRVTVNGTVVTEMGYRVLPNDVVHCDAKLLTPVKKFVYLLLNKPHNYICTVSDERGRRTVMELATEYTSERVYPVGRLDRNTTGLILLTNDGDLAQKLSHPKFEVTKVYIATLDKPLAEEHLEQIRNTLMLEDGPAPVDDISYIDGRKDNVIGLEIHIGRNRIVRRIFEHLGYEVKKLDRTRYAMLTKKNLQIGRCRKLTKAEVSVLKYMMKQPKD